MRFLIQALVAVLVVSFGQTAVAQCDFPSPQCEPNGDAAVDLPDGWTIRLPFQDGETVRVSAGYSPDGGSSLHCRASDTRCANDWFALDLVLQDHANNGYGQPVVAIADGTVLDAGAGSMGWAGYGNRVYLEHDGPDGNTYVTMYAHMESISVSTGDTVQKGDQVGTLGDTCFIDGCNLGAHLHFSIHRNSNFGGSGSGGSYGGLAVIPEPIDGYTGISAGDILTAGNGPDAPDPDPDPTPYCDIVIGAEDVVLQEDGPCGEVIGSPADSTQGNGGHSYTATHETPAPDYATGLFWHLNFESDGEYELRAYVPYAENLTNEAIYKIASTGEDTKVSVDQAATYGAWVRLGRFDFDTEPGHWVRLGDNYADETNQGKTIGMDAIRVIPTALCECDMEGASDFEQCEVAGDRSRTCDGCFYGDWTDCPPIDFVDENNGTNGGGTNGTTNGGTNGSGPGPDADDDVITAEGGCSCATTNHSVDVTVLLLLLGLIGPLTRREGE